MCFRKRNASFWPRIDPLINSMKYQDFHCLSPEWLSETRAPIIFHDSLKYYSGECFTPSCVISRWTQLWLVFRDLLFYFFFQCQFPMFAVESHGGVQLFVTPCSMPGFPVLHHLLILLELMSIELVIPPIHLILCRPLLLLPSVFPRIRVFSNELALLIRWPKYWSFSFSISPSNIYSGLISFRIDWFDLLIV